MRHSLATVLCLLVLCTISVPAQTTVAQLAEAGWQAIDKGDADRAATSFRQALTLRPGDLTFAHVRAFVDEVVTVDDAAMIAAVRWLFHEAHLVAEPSGAAAVAAALRASAPGSVAVVSGGNVDPVAYAGYIAVAAP